MSSIYRCDKCGASFPVRGGIIKPPAAWTTISIARGAWKPSAGTAVDVDSTFLVCPKCMPEYVGDLLRQETTLPDDWTKAEDD